MKALGKASGWVAAVVAQVLLTVALVLFVRTAWHHWIDGLTGFDRKQDRSFNSLRCGMHEVEVFSLMGARPAWTNHEFHVGPYRGNEREYAKTNGAHAGIFYGWVNGDNWLYCVGFDTNGLLTVKGEGGT